MVKDVTFAGLPGEFEPQAALALGFNGLLSSMPKLVVDLVDALVEHIPLIGIVNNEEQRRHAITLLCDWGLPAHLLTFVCFPVEGMWVRDYGPAFVRQPDGATTLIDAEYGMTGERPNDDRVAAQFASLLRLPVTRVPMMLEGGNVLSNGRGLCLTTTMLEYVNSHCGRNQAAIFAMLRQYYHFDSGIVLKRLTGEPTGHIDMFATFVTPNVVVMGQYDPAVDPVNADTLNYNAAYLTQLQTAAGPMKVVRIPMPSNRGNVWRTYTNVIYANGILLVPSYGKEEQATLEQALRVYADLLPGWTIKTVDASQLILRQGALRCLSLHIPWLKEHFNSTLKPCLGPLLNHPCLRSPRERACCPFAQLDSVTGMA